MAFWRTYYHLVWATESRSPLITPERESQVYGYIIGKADAIDCIIHAIGGVEDHIHLIASIPPKISIAGFVKQIKGSSAYHLNHTPSTSGIGFSWQHGYGVLTLGSKQLETAKAYVLNQKTHHLNRTTIHALEFCDEH
ncbi:MULTISPECIES: IS200/IS605 family transposase [Fischerella]|uniref:IS200/IS605 family transposase n=1 Tax=Fischerella TaxID=1190 RepID=UPI0002FC7EA8|nr:MULTISPECIES: IS200/IS605 family transposase [Fischerella]MBD2429756.1 IS200/IS605 family transposase [Fischerella sp. FACHB-380]